jgi:hypothetical protein
MKTAEYIRVQVEKMPLDTPFGYADLDLKPEAYLRGAKALERMCKVGTLQRLAKGLYTRVDLTKHGSGNISTDKLLQRFTYRNGKKVGYITGSAWLHQMNLRLRAPATLQIAGDRTGKVDIGHFKAKLIKSRVAVTEENAYSLQILDALTVINQKSNGNINTDIQVLTSLIEKLQGNEQPLLIACAEFYPPRVRALLGAILDHLRLDATNLRNLQNPLTSYQIGISTSVLPTVNNWNIK